MSPAVNQTNLELVTLATVKTYTNQQSNANDTILQTILNGCHRQLYTFLGNRVITRDSSPPTDWVYALDGTGTRFLDLPQYPIWDVSQLTIDEGYIADNTPTFNVQRTFASSDWFADTEHGVIQRITWTWPTGYNNIRVSYPAGYDTVPEDLADAICQWAAVRFMRYDRRRWDFATMTKESESWSFREKEIPDSALAVFRTYQKVSVGLG
jgi:hypothetical protein